ncbi:hypothetical protein AB0L06_28285 [Spirillospora sp. NPDC052269]
MANDSSQRSLGVPRTLLTAQVLFFLVPALFGLAVGIATLAGGTPPGALGRALLVYSLAGGALGAVMAAAGALITANLSRGALARRTALLYEAVVAVIIAPLGAVLIPVLFVPLFAAAVTVIATLRRQHPKYVPAA